MTAAVLALVSGAALAIGGCDTGDGRGLAPPVFPAPATTLPAVTLPGSGLPGDESQETASSPPEVAGLQLLAPWRDGAEIPRRHTCDGDDVSPPLTWSNVPPEAVELALSITDLDSPDFVHWVVTGLAPTAHGLAEGEVPADATVRSSGTAGRYAGPCPPEGDPPHHYLVTVHALNQTVEPADDTSATEVVAMLRLTSIDQSSVSGTYARPD